MKKLFSSCLLTGTLFAINLIVPVDYLPKANAGFGSVDSENLSYDYFGQSIPLTLRTDLVAVKFQENATRTRRLGEPSIYQELERDLNNTRGLRSGDRFKVEPFGTNYALVTVPKDEQSTRGLSGTPDYVQNSLPVFSRNNSENIVVLPNEILIKVKPPLGDSRGLDSFLSANNLSLIRPARFDDHTYLVRSNNVSGTAILSLVRQLETLPEVESASPNFIQKIAYVPANTSSSNRGLSQTNASANSNLPYQSELLPLQWHLDSRPQRGSIFPRTDLQVTDLWQNSKNGKGVTVAVIDSLIQWDHPDLQHSIITLQDNPNDEFVNEQHGWDFVAEDNDTRMSEDDKSVLVPYFQESFADPDWGGDTRTGIAVEFHGTAVTGVISARPAQSYGVLGVAPETTILPVRALGIGGYGEDLDIAEAIYYAGSRGADVINMSLGAYYPSEMIQNAVNYVLKENPNLVIVASAGNGYPEPVGYPAGYEGVLAVGATNLEGYRAYYSSIGERVDVVAPGGDFTNGITGGILTTGGTFVEDFWQGIEVPQEPWGIALDPKGQYIYIQGTSFSSPNVAGVVALLKSENPNLSREQLLNIIKETSSTNSLNLTQEEKDFFNDIGNYFNDEAKSSVQYSMGESLTRYFGDQYSLSVSVSTDISPEEFYFGHGLVNTEAALQRVRNR